MKKFFQDTKIFPLFNDNELSMNSNQKTSMNEIEEELLFVYNRLNEVNKNYNNYKHFANVKLDDLNYQVKNLELDFKYLNVDYSTLKDNIESKGYNLTNDYNNENKLGIEKNEINTDSNTEEDTEFNDINLNSSLNTEISNNDDVLEESSPEGMDLSNNNQIENPPVKKIKKSKLDKVKELVRIAIDGELNEFKKIVKEELENVSSLCSKEFLKMDNTFFTLNKNMKSLDWKIDIFNEKNLAVIKEDLKQDILKQIKQELESNQMIMSQSHQQTQETGSSNNLFKKIFNDFSVENAKIDYNEEIQTNMDDLYTSLNERKLEIKNLKSEIKLINNKLDNLITHLQTRR